jgi:acetylornithine/succinyldiaminopimelate/putrescine aminotransferase
MIEKQLAMRQFAAFFMEPIQSEGGIPPPAREYMQAEQPSAANTASDCVARAGKTTAHFRYGQIMRTH